jgi:hypothetical protein
MPRRSKRYLHLKHLKKQIDANKKNARLRFLLDMEDDFSDDIDLIKRLHYKKLIKCRYLFRRKTYKKVRTTRETTISAKDNDHFTLLCLSYKYSTKIT